MNHPLLRDLRSSDWGSAVAAGRTAVLLLHGYGSNEHDLPGLVPALGLKLPWASLRAPVELGGPAAAWCAIGAPGAPDTGSVEQATAAIWRWVDATLGDSARIVPIGFSQGGLMVTQLLRTHPERVVAPVVLAGFVAGSPQPADERLRADRPALLWGRGDADRVIPPEAIARTADYLPQHTTLHERIYPGLTHGVGADEVDDVRAFLAAEVGADAVQHP